MTTQSDVPVDFPRDYFLGGVSGFQTKLLARKIDGRFVVGPTLDEVRECWSSVEEKAQPLAEDTLVGIRIGESRFLMGHYHALERGILAARWDITPKERAWLIERVSQLVDARADGASG